jgi:alkylhydroperoxidase family enzyme
MLDSLTRPGRPAPNVFATLARNEEVFEAWLPFCRRMLAGKLPQRWREITILRVAFKCDSFYEWAQHSAIGREAGLSDAEREDLRRPEPRGDWAPTEVALIRAVDDMHDRNGWTEETWDLLNAVLDRDDVIEVAFLIGQYHLVAFALNSFGIQLESPTKEAVS